MPPALSLVTGPTFEPLTLEEALDFLRVDNADESPLIEALIAVAREVVEQHTNRALCTQTLRLTRATWPACDPYNRHAAPRTAITLPRAPLASVTTIKYYPADGGAQATLDSAAYHVATAYEPGMVALVDGQAWPDLAVRPDAVEITYGAGYDEPTAVPAILRQTVRFMLSHLYEIRGTVAVGNIVNEIPFTLRHLLDLQKVGGYCA